MKSLSLRMLKHTFCICAGVAASLALPPAGIVPAILFLSPVFYFAANALTAWLAALYVGLSSWGWFMASLYWIGSSLFVDGGCNCCCCLLSVCCFHCFWLYSGQREQLSPLGFFPTRLSALLGSSFVLVVRIICVRL